MEWIIYCILCVLLGGFFTLGQTAIAGSLDSTPKYAYKTMIWLRLAAILCGLFFVLQSPLLDPYFLLVIYLYGVYIFSQLLVLRYASSHEKQCEHLVPLFVSIAKFFAVFTVLIPIDPQPAKEKVSEEDIREMIHAASESENIDEPQKDIIENIFELDDTSIEEICTHRSQVISLSLDESDEEWRTIILDNRHTFYPVTGKDDDDIVGVLDTRDYFRLDDLSRKNVMDHAVDQPLFVSENVKVDDLFFEMQKQRIYFAIVLDEYGGMTGIVTLHDIVETILGEMHEVDDEVEPDPIDRINENQWRIYGFADLEDVQDELDVKLPVEEYDTFSGYVLGSYGHIPQDGTTFDVVLGPLDIHVKEIQNHRIGLTIVTKRKEGAQTNEQAEKDN